MTDPTPAPAAPVHASVPALVAALQAISRPAQRAGGPVEVGWGIVTAISGTTCSVQLRAGSTIAGIAHLKSYTPTVGDLVAMFEWPTASGEDRLILGARA